MKSFLKSLAAVAGIAVGILLIYLAVNYFVFKKRARIKESYYTQKQDSLNVELKKAYYIIDSLENVRIREEKQYQANLAVNNELIKKYGLKIATYEKAFNNIVNMSDAALMDSISGYYNRRFGYYR